MRNRQTIVAVTLLATALCAERGQAAAPVRARVESAPMSLSFTQRLTRNLGRVVLANQWHHQRHDGLAPQVCKGTKRDAQTVGPVLRQSLPHQFRLPPPMV